MLENCYYIKEQYFIDHDDYIKLLDPQNLDKQSIRTYLCVCIQVYNKNFYIPLRNNLGESLKNMDVLDTLFHQPNAQMQV